jgi:hypothetical protein
MSLQAVGWLYIIPPMERGLKDERRLKKKGKAVPLDAMEADGGRGGIAPTHS